MKKVLVTGSTGFIGNYVVKELLRSNCHVIASSSNINKAEECDWFTQVEYIPLNFESYNDTINYFQFFNQPETIVHLAWEGLPNYQSSFHYMVNLPRHFSFLKNLVENGAKDLTVTGTCFEYGMHEGKLNEDMPAEPHNPYALAKDTLRRQLQEIQPTYGFDLKWLRLFYMFGMGQNPGSLLSQLDKALKNGEKVFNMSGGEQVRDYLPVEKVAEYIVKVALQSKVKSIINCCSGIPITVKQLVENYLKKKNISIQLNLGYYPYPNHESMAFWGDNNKLKMITHEK